jgi:hypothetical protein
LKPWSPTIWHDCRLFLASNDFEPSARLFYYCSFRGSYLKHTSSSPSTTYHGMITSTAGSTQEINFRRSMCTQIHQGGLSSTRFHPPSVFLRLFVGIFSLYLQTMVMELVNCPKALSKYLFLQNLRLQFDTRDCSNPNV